MGTRSGLAMGLARRRFPARFALLAILDFCAEDRGRHRPHEDKTGAKQITARERRSFGPRYVMGPQALERRSGEQSVAPRVPWVRAKDGDAERARNGTCLPAVPGALRFARDLGLLRRGPRPAPAA